jgi:NADPH:quinone reductase-like Zn-dependent oxidoreductase
MAIPTKQRVVLLREFGGPDRLTVVERPVPEPRTGEVLVKVLAASVQFTDIMLRKGQYPDLKEKPPLVLGYDLVGEVVKVGPGVASPIVGQRVADLTMTGSYAQYRTLVADHCAVVDASLEPAEATSLVLSWMTAYQLLHRDARVQKGQKLLIIGAAGAVGQALVALGTLAGCKVWGAASARNADLMRALGATHVDRDGADFGQVLQERFDVVFDGIAEQGFSRAWRAVGPRGHLSAFGVSSGVQRNVSIALVGFWLAKLWWWNLFSIGRSTSFYSITSLRKKHPDWFVADLDQLLGLLKRGEIKPRIADRIGLDAVAEAHTRIERGGLEGKIVLIPNG